MKFLLLTLLAFRLLLTSQAFAQNQLLLISSQRVVNPYMREARIDEMKVSPVSDTVFLRDRFKQISYISSNTKDAEVNSVESGLEHSFSSYNRMSGDGSLLFTRFVDYIPSTGTYGNWYAAVLDLQNPSHKVKISPDAEIIGIVPNSTLAFTRNSEIGGDNSYVSLIDLKVGKELRRLIPPKDGLGRLIETSDDQTLFVIHGSQFDYIYDFKTFTEVRRHRPMRYLRDQSSSSKYSLYVSESGDKIFSIWSWETGSSCEIRDPGFFGHATIREDKVVVIVEDPEAKPEERGHHITVYNAKDCQPHKDIFISEPKMTRSGRRFFTGILTEKGMWLSEEHFTQKEIYFWNWETASFEAFNMPGRYVFDGAFTKSNRRFTAITENNEDENILMRFQLPY